MTPPTPIKRKGRLHQATLSLKLDSARDDSGDACLKEGIVIVVVIGAQHLSHRAANIPQNSTIALITPFSGCNQRSKVSIMASAGMRCVTQFRVFTRPSRMSLRMR